MNNQILHSEITCPYCRIQFGGYKISKDTIEHLDIFWSYESGLIKTCEQQDYVKSNIVSIDDNQNPIFNDDFKKKIDELQNNFYTKPDDISKNNFTWDNYFIAFCDCMNWGYVDEEGEEYDRDNMTVADVQKLYDSGMNLYDALRCSIKKIDIKKEDETSIPEKEIIEVKTKTFIDKIKDFLKWKK